MSGTCLCRIVWLHTVSPIHGKLFRIRVGFLCKHPNMHWSIVLALTPGSFASALNSLSSHIKDVSGFSIEKAPPDSTATRANAAVLRASLFAISVISNPNPSGRSCVRIVLTCAMLSFRLADEKVRQGGAACTQLTFLEATALRRASKTSSLDTSASWNSALSFDKCSAFTPAMLTTAWVRPALP